MTNVNEKLLFAAIALPAAIIAWYLFKGFRKFKKTYRDDFQGWI